LAWKKMNMRHPDEFSWPEIQEPLRQRGYVRIPQVLAKAECVGLRNMYSDESNFRSVISMERYRFGKGEYKYLKYPLPSLVEGLRTKLYPNLAVVANEWMTALGLEMRFPAEHHQLIDECRSHDQVRPTPLILKYTSGGYNTLHQDLYGDIYFPFQVVFLLSQPGDEFEGGEFVLIEQIPRAQSRAHVITLAQGDALVFTTNFRPAKGARGFYRTIMKHGVSEVTSGERFAMGIIFHDAR
jgi:uncharacterized protein